MRNISSFFLLILIISFFTQSADAQKIPCDSEKGISVLKKGKSFKAECDSMVVLNKVTYNALTEKYSDLVFKLDDMQKKVSESPEQGSELKTLREFINKQNSTIKIYKTAIDTLDKVIIRANQNNEKLNSDLNRSQTMLYWFSIATFVVGLAVGALIFHK
jgi:peptidoglycan hydrolase CwlO-like protein